MSRFVLFTCAAMVGTMLAVITNPFARAADFQDSESLARRLVAVTGAVGAPAPSVDLNVRFKVGSADLTDGARRQLDALARALTSPALAGARFAVNGHTDASGKADLNKALSERRARAVKAYLVRHHGIKADRLAAAGLGESRLKNPFAPDSAENRRVEIVNLAPDADLVSARKGEVEAIGR